MRSYRVTVVGRFEGLTGDQKRVLREKGKDHDMFTAEFTPEGTFIYSEALTRFTVRCFVTSDELAPADADLAAVMEAEEIAARILAAQGVGHLALASTFVCLEDVKVRAPKK